MGIGATLYCLWATLAIGLALALAGRSTESVTRLVVLVFLGVQIAGRARLVQALPRLSPQARFLVLGTVLATVVEGCHMISMPVFFALRIGWETSLTQGLRAYALDLLFTVPAYLVIFAVIWRFVNRYPYPLWHYVVVMGLAQALGDGGLFFWWNAPAMLFFLPYPMTNDRVPEQLNVSFHWHILATESKRLPSYTMQVEGKRWTISHGFAVTIKTAVTMANAVLTT